MIINPVEYLWRKLNKIMHINHVKAFSVYLFSSIEIDSVLAKLLIYINNMNLACSAD